MARESYSGVASAIREAESTVALTGAGVSTASGIPDFRSEDGIWSEYDPADFNVSRFRSDPEGFWRQRVDLVEELFGDDFEPNSAHEALADLEAAGLLERVVTQNVDGLHQAAGSDDPVELHGNGQRVVCTGCDRRQEAEPVFDRAREGELPPTCRWCDSVLKPDVVLFGERLPVSALEEARRLARESDVFFAIGSSLTVEPAATLPRLAAESGATLVVINLERTPLTARADVELREDVTEALPAIASAALDE